MKPGDSPQDMRIVRAKVHVEAELANGNSITLTFHEFNFLTDSDHGVTLEEEREEPVYRWDKFTAYYPPPSEHTLTIKGKLLPLAPSGETHRYQIHPPNETGDQ